MMTLNQFRATRTECADLGEAMRADYFELSPRAGFMYAGDAYIEKESDGSFLLTLHNEQYADTDIAPLEARLYAWALTECPDDMGVTTKDENALIAALVAYTPQCALESDARYICSIADTVEAITGTGHDNISWIAECLRRKNEKRINDALQEKLRIVQERKS